MIYDENCIEMLLDMIEDMKNILLELLDKGE